MARLCIKNQMNLTRNLKTYYLDECAFISFLCSAFITVSLEEDKNAEISHWFFSLMIIYYKSAVDYCMVILLQFL